MSGAPNPFAAPKTESYSTNRAGDDRGEVWRFDKTLIFRVGARLPHRCLKCNRPATTRLQRTLQWHHAGWYLLLFANLIVYLIAAMIVRKTASVALPLCEAHNQRRKTGMFIMLGSAAIGIGGCTAGLSVDQPAAVLLAMFTFLVGVVVGAVQSSVLTPTKIDATYVRAKGASPEFLATLPPFPGSGPP
ncbi:MAG: hypothetical protein IPG45_11160 [Deltaproteobacteria bacterium]|nr:hypothetical protein [Deltaproteobacteria bacterium]